MSNDRIYIWVAVGIYLIFAMAVVDDGATTEADHAVVHLLAVLLGAVAVVTLCLIVGGVKSERQPSPDKESRDDWA